MGVEAQVDGQRRESQQGRGEDGDDGNRLAALALSPLTRRHHWPWVTVHGSIRMVTVEDTSR